MNVEEFTGFAQSKDWKTLSNGAYGVYNGYPFSAQFLARNGGQVTVSFRADGKAGAKFVRGVRKALPKGCAFMAVVANSRYSLTCTAKTGDLTAAFTASMDAVTGAMRSQGLRAPERCPICKQGGCESTAMIAGAYTPVHRICVEQHGTSARARATEALRGNYLTGLLGAVLGGVVGTIPAIIGLTLLERYVAILYALIPLAAYHGYRLFKGKMNSGALVCTILSSLLNLFTVEFFSIFIQLAQIREAIPTFGFAWRVFRDYTQDSSFIGSIVMDIVFLALGIFFTWGQIRRTAVHDVQDAGLAAATLLVNGRDPVPQGTAASATPSADGGYHMVPPAAPRPTRSDDPWDD